MDIARQTPAITRWVASGQDLTCIQHLGLPKLRRVRELDVSHNRLLSLSELAELPRLTKLDASHNSLSAALDFEFVGEPDDDAVEAVATGSSSCLTEVNLAHNSIKRLRELAAHQHLRQLNLAHNALSEVTGLASLRHLAVLDLRHNGLVSMRGLSGLTSLQALHLDGNKLQCLGGLDGMQLLHTLTVSGNALRSLEGVQGASLLRTLDARDNSMADLYSVEPLMQLPVLGDLHISGNVFLLRTQQCRLRLLYRLEGLASLDGQPVTAAEKVAARNLHGADLDERRATFHAILPDQMFTNTLPYIDVEEEARHSEEAYLERMAFHLATEAIEEGAAQAQALQDALLQPRVRSSRRALAGAGAAQA